MPDYFDSLTLTTARSLVQEPPGFREAEAMVYRENPDQWTCGGTAGTGFLGPTGLDTRGLSEQQQRAVSGLNASVQSGLKRNFTPVDRLSEVQGRRIDGALGNVPDKRFEVRRVLGENETPTDDETARLRELDAVIEWAEARRTNLHTFLRRLHRAETAFGRGYLRPLIPAGRFRPDADGNESLPEVKDLPGALQHIFGEVVTPDRAVLYEDPDTQQECSVVTFGAERARGGRASIKASAEISYPKTAEEGEAAADVKGYPLTVVRVVTTSDETGRAEYPLRGRPMLVELRDDEGAFIDETARQLQKAINTASTERRIVNDEDGFRVRMLLGARPPGRWVPSADPNQPPTFEPEPWAVGPRAILNVGGEETYATDPNGGTAIAGGVPVVSGVSRPSVATFEAADAERYAKEVEDRTVELRERCKQGWVGATGEAGVSGISREVAMADYLTDATAQAKALNVAGATFLELVADLAAHLIGQPGRYYDLRAVVECRVSKPPIRPDERTATLALVEKGVWSRERAMRANDVDDPTAEKEAIAAEKAAEAEARGAETLSLFGVPGVTANETGGNA